MDANVSLGLDNSGFDQKIQQSEQKAAGFAGRLKSLLGRGKNPWEEFLTPPPGSNQKIDSLQHRIEKLFARDPGRRGEVAFIGLAQSLASGDLIGGIESIAGRISGIGLVAGVAIGASVAIFSKLKGQVDATYESAKRLGEVLAVPRSVIANLGLPGIKAEISELVKGMDDLAAKRDSAGTKARDFLANDPLLSFGMKGNVGKGTQAEVNSAAKRVGESLQDQASAEAKISAIAEARLSGRRQEADLMEIQRKGSEQIAQIEKDRIGFQLALFRSKVSPETRDKLIAENNANAAARKGIAGGDIDIGVMAIMKSVVDSIKLTVKDLVGLAKPEFYKGADWSNRSDEMLYREYDYNKMSPKAAYNSMQARKAQDLNRQADDLMLRGGTPQDMLRAGELRDQSKAILKDIPTLKDSEKGDPSVGFAQALNATAVPHLVSIEAILGRLSFANQ